MKKFSKDISALELFAFWKAKNPTSTDSWSVEIEDQINTIANADSISPEIATDVIENLWRQTYRLRCIPLRHSNVRR